MSAETLQPAMQWRLCLAWQQGQHAVAARCMVLASCLAQTAATLCVLLQDPECGCVFDSGKQLPEDPTEDKDAVCTSSAPALLIGLGPSRSVEVCCVSCLLVHKAGCTEQGMAGPASLSTAPALLAQFA